MTIGISLIAAGTALIVFAALAEYGASTWESAGLAVLAANFVAAVLAIIGENYSDREGNEDRPL